MAGMGIGPGGLGVLSALERSALLHSGTGSAASSGVPSPGQPASPAINKKQRTKVMDGQEPPMLRVSEIYHMRLRGQTIKHARLTFL